MKKNYKKAFTLVEILVALTIFSIIMISVMSIYLVSSETTYNSDINRAMQENVKIVSLDLSENIIKSWISWVANDSLSTLALPSETEVKAIEWKYLQIWNLSYYLATKNSSWDYVEASNCDQVDKEEKFRCYLVKKEASWEANQLTNSLVNVRDVNFLVTNFNWIPKVTISLKIQPSAKAWVRPGLVEKNIFYFQTTLSKR